MLLATSLLAAATTQPSPDTLEDNYQLVLAEMKHPPATGILVTEIEPESPAGAAGLLPGDVIYHYAGGTVRDLDSLRKKVADVFASQLAENNDNKVLLGVHRAGNDVILQLPRAPLGIRALEIDAGVPAPPNPPPSLRGSITLAWSDLLQNQSPDAPASFFRTADAAGDWTGWQRRTVTAADNAFVCQSETARVDPRTGAVLASESVSLRFRIGDYIHEPAFVLDSLDVSIHNPDASILTTTAQRAGLVLRARGQTAFPNRVLLAPEHEVACPLDALPDAALPLLAAALPQPANGDGAALQLHLLSPRDLLARPGYLLIARGKQPLPPANDPANQAWRVDLLHCGIVVETFWLADQQGARHLIQLDTQSATPLYTRPVASLDEAAHPITPTTQPTATQP